MPLPFWFAEIGTREKYTIIQKNCTFYWGCDIIEIEDQEARFERRSGMIDFAGGLSGDAEKCFLTRTVAVELLISLIGLLFPLPVAVFLAIRMRKWILLGVYLGLMALMMLMVCIPKSKKERKAITPKRIYIVEEEIICVTERSIEARRICDVKQVRDYGAFYELRCYVGPVSRSFICQKDLLTKGSLKEFEALFVGKIQRM